MSTYNNAKPLLSIIVVTWNNENFIEEALESCIFETEINYEVVVVHNASDDKTGEMIQRVANGNKLFKVIENSKNEGLGKARNIGIDNADGEYLIFLDGDDWINSKGIVEVLDRLTNNKPDVLIYDYQRVWDTGWVKRNQLNELLYEHDASSVEDRNTILSVFCIACNKVYKKSFLNSISIRFTEGYYEDVPWSYTVILKAKSIYVTPFIVLNYRQRTGSILKSTDSRHLILCDRYAYLLNMMMEDPVLLKLYGHKMLELARAHLFSKPIWPRLPASDRSKYLIASANVITNWRAALNVKSKDNTLSVARLGVPILYTAGKKIVPTQKKIKRIFSRLKSIVYKRVLCKLPVREDLAYVEAYWGKKIDGNPIDIAKYLTSNKICRVYVGVDSKVDVPRDFNLQVVRIGSFKYWYILAISKYLFSDVNLTNTLIKRKKSVHIQTKHGTPFKHMGIDNRGKVGHSLNWGAFAKRCRRWDYVVSSNPYSSRIWRRSYPYNYKVLECGYPRNDILINHTEEEVLAIKKRLGIPSAAKVALYAPTFRDYDKSIKLSEVMHIDKLKKALGEEYYLLVRAHSFTSCSNLESGVSSKVLDVSSYNSTSELCLISDLLITDYSSIMFDYACLLRPIVLYHYDYDRYVKERGVYFDISKNKPGLIAYNFHELLSVLATKKYYSKESEAMIASFNKEFCPWDDGAATKRVVDRVVFEREL